VIIMQPSILSNLRTTFGEHLRENRLLSGYTAARVGGPADVLLFVRSAEELARAAEELWEMDIPFILFGGGSNVLVSDLGIRGVVIMNRARRVKFSLKAGLPTVHAESGTTPNQISQKAARLGWTGFEWAAGIPGSLGGALYGNAGAFGSEIARNLASLELIHRDLGRQVWPVEKMEYGYRTSVLKREHPPILILSAELSLNLGDPQVIHSKMEQYSERRRMNQPLGASMGSIFKNPAGSKAGQLIEAAGLKGTRVGNAEISTMHANFFINHGKASANDFKALVDLAQKTVAEKFGIKLELEVELVGEWQK
jgi:UDP-N-acetylmuramate dehydrogenase